MTETAQKIGLRLRQLRLERGWRQYEFEGVGISDKKISDIEKGKVGITVQTLSKICGRLGMTLKEFFDEEI